MKGVANFLEGVWEDSLERPCQHLLCVDKWRPRLYYNLWIIDKNCMNLIPNNHPYNKTYVNLYDLCKEKWIGLGF